MQHDHNWADQLFPAMRSDMNTCLQAIQTKNSGDLAPGVTFPFMWWIDTGQQSATQSLIKMRAEADSGWVTIGLLDASTWTPYFQGAPLGNASTRNVGTNPGQLPPAESVLTNAGGTLVGALTLSGNPVAPLHAAPKQYVDGISGVPTGVMFPYAGSAAPPGYLLCDGSAVSRATYASLFAVIGSTYGAGDGVNTFNVPDCRDKNVVGVSGTKARGTSGGSATINSVPAHTHHIDFLSGFFGDHTHTFTTGTESAAHTHADNAVATNATGYGAGANTLSATPIAGTTGTESATHTHSGTTATSSIGDHSHAIQGDTQSTGGATVSVQNPYVAANYIIRT